MKHLKLYEQFSDFEDFSEKEIFGKGDPIYVANIKITPSDYTGNSGTEYYIIQKQEGNGIYLYKNFYLPTFFLFPIKSKDIISFDDLSSESEIKFFDNIEKFFVKIKKRNITPDFYDQVKKSVTFTKTK